MRRRRLASLVLSSVATASLLAMACNEDPPTVVTAPDPDNLAASGGSAAEIARRTPPDKITVCHVDEFGVSHLIAISERAWPAHERHGDVQFVDADGDGWVAGKSECFQGGDCDDTNPDVHPGAAEVCDGLDTDCDGVLADLTSVLGTQTGDIRRDHPDRRRESAMGNLVADAMRLHYPEADAAIVNSGSLRQDLLFAGSPTGGADGQITCLELFSVLPFGNRIVLLTVTGAQLVEALVNGVLPSCDPSVSTGRTAQVSGLKLTYSCNGVTPVVTGLLKTSGGGPPVPIGPNDTIRLVTNDFMAAGSEGYTVLGQATDVVEPDETLLEVLTAYVAANSPVSAAVEGRIVQE